jgi:ABC-type glycerol-3-phosphate transport system substrate-binding protein
MQTDAYRPAKHRSGNAGRWLMLLVVLVAAGCMALPTPAPGSTSVAPSTPPPPTGSANLTPSGSTGAGSPTPGLMTLTWWAPEFLSPKAPQPAGPLLAEQLADFEAAQNGKVRLAVVPKARYGKGGLLDFLRTAQPVAPAILPDLVVLDVSELEVAAAVGLLQPLDGLLDKSITDRLYPFAVSAGKFGDHLLAVQYAADLDHLAYRQDEVRMPPPTWAALLDAQDSYLAPVGSPQPGAAGQAFGGLQYLFISQYLSAGAAYDPAMRVLAVEREPLQRLLDFYDTAEKSGVLPPAAKELSDADAVWNAFAQGAAPLADVSARRYLSEEMNLKNTSYAESPGWAGPVTPIAGGWALAITTTDPARQQAAAALIAQLLEPENSGRLAAAGGWLPTSPDSLQTWGANPYHTFLDARLASAISPPAGADSAQAAARIRKALDSVINGESDPAAAVEAAINPPK